MKSYKDPAIERVRIVRRAVSKKYPRAQDLVAHYSKLQQKYADRLMKCEERYHSHAG